MIRTLHFAFALVAATAFSPVALAQTAPPIPAVLSVTSMPNILQDSINSGARRELQRGDQWGFVLGVRRHRDDRGQCLRPEFHR